MKKAEKGILNDLPPSAVTLAQGSLLWEGRPSPCNYLTVPMYACSSAISFTSQSVLPLVRKLSLLPLPDFQASETHSLSTLGLGRGKGEEREREGL